MNEIIKCRFCGEVMEQNNGRHICPGCAATVREEDGFFIWTIPDHPDEERNEPPTWDVLFETGTDIQERIEELHQMLVDAEAKAGYRNDFARHILNRTLAKKGLEAAF